MTASRSAVRRKIIIIVVVVLCRCFFEFRRLILAQTQQHRSPADSDDNTDNTAVLVQYCLTPLLYTVQQM